MEDKKVKAGSVAVGICLFVIAILLVLIVLFFYNSNAEKHKLQEQISELETAIDEKDEKVNELENKISKVQELISNEEDSNENYLSKQEMIKLLNEIDDKISRKGVLHELRVRKIESKNSKFLIEADYYVPVEITEEEYKKLINSADIVDILGFSGKYKKENENASLQGNEYGFVEIESQDFDGNIEYEIVKTDIGYAFVSIVGGSYPMNILEKKVSFYLDENDIIHTYQNGEKNLKEYYETISEDSIDRNMINVSCSDGELYLSESGK